LRILTRVLIVDDHPALRAGLATVLRMEPGMVVVGAASRASEAVRKVKLSWPEVVLVDYQLPDADGLALCQQLKVIAESPAVLIYSAYADGSLAIAAMVAGADGLVNKAAPAAELIDALRNSRPRRDRGASAFARPDGGSGEGTRRS
jgi:DNA-binding NarL/FixJ family response regulator